MDRSRKQVPTPKAQGPLQKMGKEDYKSQRIRKFAVRSRLLIMSETTPIESHQHELNMDNKRYTKVDGGRVRVDYRPQPDIKN